MKIEILGFDGCPNHKPAEKLVREVVEELHINAEIEIIKVLDNEDAEKKRFLGSPSIRINGKDIEMVEDESTQYSMRCRLYRNEGKLAGLPSRRLLISALSEAVAGKN